MERMALRGRDEPVSRALGALEQAAGTGQGALVVVTGEPGIGKSALLANVAEHAVRSGFVVGTGKAEHGDQIAPGAPLLVSLRSGPRPLLPGDAFASLAPLYDKPLWLVDRISGLLEELAVGAPVLIVIDDVQWADRLTRFALRVLPARLAGSPVVWALASRSVPDDALEEVIAGTDGATVVTRIALGPLTAADIEDIAADRLGTAPSEQTRYLLDGVAGNPFWAVQVLQGLARRRARGQGTGDLHAELATGVRARLDELSPDAVDLVRAAAVWGAALTVRDGAGLLGRSDAHTRRLIAEGVDRGLLTVVDGDVHFPHDLVREAVYADIEPERRRELHRASARHVDESGGSALTAATHFGASAVRDDEEAIEALMRAAQHSTLPEQALELARRAFALTSESHPLHIPTGEQVVAALVDVQREGDALELAERLRTLTEDPEVLARIEIHACRALWCASDCEQMELRAAVALGRDGVSDVLRAQLGAAQALAASRTASAAHAEDLAGAAFVEGKRLRDDYSQRLAIVALIESARNEGRHGLALDRFTDLRRLSDSAYQAEEIRTLQHLDRYDDAEAMLAKIREAHDDVDGQLPPMLYAQMWQDHNLARFDAAEAGARTLLRLADETGNYGFRLNARMILAAIATYRGDHALAAQWLQPVETDDGARAGAPRLRLMRGFLSASTGDYVASLTVLRPLLDTDDEPRDPWPWSPPWSRILARIGVAGGDEDFAARAAALADLAARRNPGVATLEGTAEHVRGLLADDPGQLSDAVRMLRDSPRPLLVADALADFGASLLRHGRAGEATTTLVEAAGMYQRIGAATGSRTVAKLLRDHGVRGVLIDQQAPRPTTGWAALTPTELRVVELVSAGHTNRSAATELGVSPNTVNTHLRAVFRKLDVKSRVQLTIAARQRANR
jgi:DNA-binding CsgD family transcriptional regulator